MQQIVALIFICFYVTNKKQNATIELRKPTDYAFRERMMTLKISRTIKRLRNEKGMTQEQLAQQLFISRQAVSSWENDRTQPDIDMLIKLTEVFSVPVEELIYGKKRNTGLETEKTVNNNTLLIVFSILGTLLAGTGIVLIFVYFWQQMSMIFKAILSLLPMLAGQAAGIFVLMRKKDKIPWCEGAGILWTAGIAATFTMIYNIFTLSITDWWTILLIISVLILPVMILLRSVSILAVYYICVIAGCLLGIDDLITYDSFPFTAYFLIVFTMVLIAAGWIYSHRKMKNEDKSYLGLSSHWLSVIALTAFSICLFLFTGDGDFAMIAAGAVGICLLTLSIKDSDITMPYRIPGLLLTGFMLFINCIMIYSRYEFRGRDLFFEALLCLIILVPVIFAKKKTKDIFFICYLGLSLLSFIISQIPVRISHSDDGYHLIFIVISAAANIMLMISGGKEKKLLPINIGFIGIAALTILIVTQSGFTLIGNGILLVIFGGVLLAINYTISRSNRKKNTVQPLTEVTENE